MTDTLATATPPPSVRLGGWTIPLAAPPTVARCLALVNAMEDAPWPFAGALILSCWAGSGGAATADPDPNGAVPTRRPPPIRWSGDVVAYGEAALDALIEVLGVSPGEVAEAIPSAMAHITARLSALPTRPAGNG